MISMIIGNKGSGKTKRLVELVNAAVDSSNGNVVCIEKGAKLTYDLTHKARLVDSDEYCINDYDSLFGFICGMFAGNYDLTDLFVDATLRIGGRDYDKFADFVERLNAVCSKLDTKVTFTVSCDEGDLPEKVFKFAKKI
ncbi:MAG: hypothetical protein PUB05_01880 [Firmicutes bacterium]|nr:hypothetical protein [Bacillota bacterium]